MTDSKGQRPAVRRPGNEARCYRRMKKLKNKPGCGARARARAHDKGIDTYVAFLKKCPRPKVKHPKRRGR